MFYTTKTLADAVGVTENTVKGHLHGKYEPLKLVGVKFAGRWFFDEAGKQWYQDISPSLKVGKRADGWFDELLKQFPPPPQPDNLAKDESA